MRRRVKEERSLETTAAVEVQLQRTEKPPHCSHLQQKCQDMFETKPEGQKLDSTAKKVLW